jgi:hypothetical protein
MPARLINPVPPRIAEAPAAPCAAPRDQLVRIPVNVRARSFPATIRETSSRPNQHKSDSKHLPIQRRTWRLSPIKATSAEKETTVGDTGAPRWNDLGFGGFRSSRPRE